MNSDRLTLDDVGLEIGELVGVPARPVGGWVDGRLDDPVNRLQGKLLPVTEKRTKMFEKLSGMRSIKW